MSNADFGGWEDIASTEVFMEAMENYKPKPFYHYQKKKRHIPMIAQFLYTPSRAYRWVLDFMGN